MRHNRLLQKAVAALCARFEHGGYNSTPAIDLGVLVANADGVVDENETAALGEIFEALFGARFNFELVGFLIQASREVIEAAGVDSRVRLVAEILKDCEAVEQGIAVALGVAYASEGLSDAERGIITRIAKAAELPDERLERLIEKVRISFEGEPA